MNNTALRRHKLLNENRMERHRKLACVPPEAPKTTQTIAVSYNPKLDCKILLQKTSLTEYST